MGMLEVACGAAKLKFPHLKKVIGIAIDAPKYASTNSEDFVLMDCQNWTDEERAHYAARQSGVSIFQDECAERTSNARDRFSDSPSQTD